jgi:hypothetical protein
LSGLNKLKPGEKNECNRKYELPAIETEIKLLINQRLYEKKAISAELFEQAKVLILKPSRNGSPANRRKKSNMEAKNC